MVKKLRFSLRALFSILLALVVTACSASGTSGLNSFQSPDGRYAFLYPNGWTRVAVEGGPAVVFHDLINSDETLSLVVSKVENSVLLEGLGSPETVGERLVKEVIAPEGAGRDVELLDAKERDASGHTFYDLEYSVHLEDRDRHEIATLVIDRGYLYTLATSTNQQRWPKVKDLFNRVIESFTFLI